MGAPRLGKALDQRLRAGVEEEAADVDFGAAQLIQHRQQVRQRAGGTHIDRDRHAVHAVAAFDADEILQQLGGQVVDAEEARVLQRVQGDRFAGTRDARDEHDGPAGRRGSGLVGHRAALRPAGRGSGPAGGRAMIMSPPLGG
jgi:hypothetical protein